MAGEQTTSGDTSGGEGQGGDTSGGEGFASQMSPTSLAGEANQLDFIISQHLARVHTIKLVKVMKITNGGGGALAVAGNVDVQVLTKQMDGEGNVRSYATTHNLLYKRIHGGVNAIIMDPDVNDMGIALIADRDISAVKAAKGEAQPGSRRRFDLADGIYVGGVLNGIPKQFIQFRKDGITITDVNGNVIKTQASTPSISLTPAPGTIAYIGGDGTSGTYDFIKTVTGVAINFKARIG